MKHPVKTLFTLTAVGVLTLGLSACSDDDEGAGSSEHAAFCDTKAAIDAVPAMSPTWGADVQELVVELDGQAPAELDGQVATIGEAFELIAAGDESPFEDPAFSEATGEVSVWVHEHCGFDAVTIKSVDYSFEGLPATIDAGRVSFLNVNEGEEPHVAVLTRVREDVDLSDPAALFGGEGPPDGVEMIGAAFVPPGGSDGFVADLEPGKYFVFCDIPVGMEEDGDPHYLHGMQGTFTVS